MIIVPPFLIFFFEQVVDANVWKLCTIARFLTTRRIFPHTSPRVRPCGKTKRQLFSRDFYQPRNCSTVPAEIKDSNKFWCSSNNPVIWPTFTLNASQLDPEIVWVSPEQLVSAIFGSRSKRHHGISKFCPTVLASGSEADESTMCDIPKPEVLVFSVRAPMSLVYKLTLRRLLVPSILAVRKSHAEHSPPSFATLKILAR